MAKRKKAAKRIEAVPMWAATCGGVIQDDGKLFHDKEGAEFSFHGEDGHGHYRAEPVVVVRLSDYRRLLRQSRSTCR